MKFPPLGGRRGQKKLRLMTSFKMKVHTPPVCPIQHLVNRIEQSVLKTVKTDLQSIPISFYSKVHPADKGMSSSFVPPPTTKNKKFRLFSICDVAKLCCIFITFFNHIWDLDMPTVCKWRLIYP